MNDKGALTWGSQPWSADRRGKFMSVDCLEPASTRSMLRLLKPVLFHYSILQYYRLTSQGLNKLIACTPLVYELFPCARSRPPLLRASCSPFSSAIKSCSPELNHVFTQMYILRS